MNLEPRFVYLVSGVQDCREPVLLLLWDSGHVIFARPSSCWRDQICCRCLSRRPIVTVSVPLCPCLAFIHWWSGSSILAIIWLSHSPIPSMAGIEMGCVNSVGPMSCPLVIGGKLPMTLHWWIRRGQSSIGRPFSVKIATVRKCTSPILGIALSKYC
jgi:hypothetical protein